MYYYVIDPQKINQKQFERVQNQLYSCVSDLKISGEMSRVTPLRTIPQLVDTSFMRGATTIVAVGHDSTLQDIINAVGDRDIAIGYVPVEETEMAKVLGITDVANACQTLAHRRVESLDLGQINNNYFFTKIGLGINFESFIPKSWLNVGKLGELANLKPIPVKMEIDGQFSAEFEVALGAIYNSRAMKTEVRMADPTDGVLDILMLPGITSFDAWKYRNELANGILEKIPGCAVVHGKRISITGPEGLPFLVGDRVIAKAPTIIQSVANKVRMIVGKDRTF